MFESTLYPGISDALEALATAEHPLLIVTSKPTVFARGIIEHVGLGRLFKTVYGSELDGTRGRKQELIAHALQQEAIGSNQAVMIGNREHDIRGAIANGVRPVGVLWGYGSREELVQAGASMLCESPESLVKNLVSQTAAVSEGTKESHPGPCPGLHDQSLRANRGC
jgi:phosphoglycolate phosphatase